MLASATRLIKKIRFHARSAARLSAVGEARLREIQLALAEIQVQLAEPDVQRLHAAGLPPDASVPPAHVRPRASELCKSDSFEEPCFLYWTRRLHQKLRYHRKLWEFTYICQALHERGMLGPGRRGLGFGVGQEPLPALFAQMGTQVLGTDMAAEDAVGAGWATTGQHAAQKAQMFIPGLCDRDQFDRLVDFRTADMNAIPSDLRDFDFCWSACCFEHLGSIENGLRFFENSLASLKPGGVAVHTTEFNLSSNHETIDSGPTVLFRRTDIEELVRRLQARGCEVAPLDLSVGSRPVDRYLDVPPYRDEPQLKLALWGYACTSIGIIARKPG